MYYFNSDFCIQHGAANNISTLAVHVHVGRLYMYLAGELYYVVLVRRTLSSCGTNPHVRIRAENTEDLTSFLN